MGKICLVKMFKRQKQPSQTEFTHSNHLHPISVIAKLRHVPRKVASHLWLGSWFGLSPVSSGTKEMLANP
jgi:hypothetical protein